jgi:ribosomal protein S14
LLDLGERKNMHIKRTAKERFLKYVEKNDNGCWNWLGHKNKKGYGFFYTGIRSQPTCQAHRYSLLFHGHDLIEGFVVDHVCSNKKCVNPGHLRQVTRTFNMFRERNRKLTHCVKGHEFTEASRIYYLGGGSGKYRNRCRICFREYQREWEKKKRKE